MTPQQQFALTITRATRTGRASIRDNDLDRLADAWPDLRDVFEEVQYLRDQVTSIEAMIAREEADWV